MNTVIIIIGLLALCYILYKYFNRDTFDVVSIDKVQRKDCVKYTNTYMDYTSINADIVRMNNKTLAQLVRLRLYESPLYLSFVNDAMYLITQLDKSCDFDYRHQEPDTLFKYYRGLDSLRDMSDEELLQSVKNISFFDSEFMNGQIKCIEMEEHDEWVTLKVRTNDHISRYIYIAEDGTLNINNDGSISKFAVEMINEIHENSDM